MTVATAPTVEIGYAQQAVSNWWLYDPNETTPELQWPMSVYVYDQMRRQDAQVTSVLRAVTLPVRRTPWRIDPNGARAEVVQFVADDLGLPIVGSNPGPPPRSKDRFSWPEHLRQALLMLPFGHMFFEIVFRVSADGSRAHLRKLAPRMPRTIERIDVADDGGLISISQYWMKTTERPKPIPVDRLVAYVHELEGGNWLGTSILRPAYKNWLLKDRLLRVQAQTIERNGMGIPLYKAQENATATDMASGLAMATAWRAGDAAGSATPFGADLVLRGVEGTLPDAEPAIRYHDEQIARAVLAHFLNLGTQTGSWALGTTFADFFTLSLQTLAQQIADTATCHIVEDMVDINFGPDEPAPRVTFDEIGSRQAATAAAIKTLVDAGVIRPDEVLEESSRQQYGLPPADPSTVRTPPAAGGAPDPNAGAAQDLFGPNSVAAAAGEPDPKDVAADAAPVAAKFNPDEPRIPGGPHGGEWGHGPGGVVKDALKLAGRIDLDPGETLVGSEKVVGDSGTVRLAATARGGEHLLRIGVGNSVFGSRDSETGVWDGGPGRVGSTNAERAKLRTELDALERGPQTPAATKRMDELNNLDLNDLQSDGATARIDAAGRTKLGAALADAADRGTKKLAEINDLYDRYEAAQKNQSPDLAALDAQVSNRDPSTIAEGVVRGDWGDVHYYVEVWDPTEGVITGLAVVPHGSGDTFDDLMGSDQGATLTEAEVRKLVRVLGSGPVHAAGEDAETAALVVAFAELTGQVLAADWNPQEHLRDRHGEFRTMLDRIAGALTKWHAEGSHGDPLGAQFNREQLRRTAVSVGLNPKRGASENELKKLFYDHTRTRLGGDKPDLAPGDKTAQPQSPNAVAPSPLDAGIKSGVKSREHITTAGLGRVDLVTFNDGSRAIHKKHTTADAKRQTDAAQLAATTAEALGIKTPAVRRINDREIYMEYVASPTAYFDPKMDVQTIKELAASQEGRRLGLFDLLISYDDRSNRENWAFDGGHVTALDHDTAWEETGRPDKPLQHKWRQSPFDAQFIDGKRWKAGAVTADEAAQVRAELERLAPQFEKLGRSDWHDFMLKRLAAIAGTTSAPGGGARTASVRSDALAEFRAMSAADARDALDLKKVDELKPMLREAGLPVSGRKRDLVDRLVEHVHGGDAKKVTKSVKPTETPVKPALPATPQSASVDVNWRPLGVTAVDEANLRQALKRRQPVADLPGGGDKAYVERLSLDLNRERLLGQFIARQKQLGSQKPAQVKEALAERAKEAFAGRPIAINMGTESLAAMLTDGRFKTQLETGRSGGTYQPDERLFKERVWFGLAADVDPATRPVYGYLVTSDSSAALVSTYGDHRVVLKDSVRTRTTAMFGDSMEHSLEGAPRSIDDPDWAAFTPGSDDNSHRPIGRLDRQITGSAFNKDTYIEAQVHGGVRAEDIAEVILPTQPTAQLRALLQQGGIPWRVRGSH